VILWPEGGEHATARVHQLLGGAAAWPLAARAQQPVTPTIGFLSASREDFVSQQSLPAFRQGLRQLGFLEGQNVAIEYRWANGEYERLPALVADLVGRRVAVITTTAGTASALAAKAATKTIPIVFNIGTDPVKDGLVESFNRPGGNVTGVSYLSAELEPKRLQILHELIPHAGVIAVLTNPTLHDTAAVVKDLEAAAGVIGQELVVLKASSQADFDAAFANMTEKRIGALLVAADPFLTANRDQLVLLTTRHAMPTMFPWREYVGIGGLMSYGTSLTDAYRLVGLYTGQVLKGANPADLPIQQSVKVELVLNLKAAKVLRLTFPLSLLARADEVIE
jgi:putative ABC transport system substrate-binding protein